MTRFKLLFAALAVAAIVTVLPGANAQTAHVVGVGSSAQFLGTMIGMSELAINNLASGQCIYHWTKKNALEAHDNRDSLNRILDETGNLGVVWDAACSDSTGNTNVTDVWLDGQYDSTLGVRLFSAQQKSPTAGPGATVYLNGTAAGTISDNLVSPATLWADNKADVAIPAAVVSFIGTAAPGTLHVNMGLTDIRPEDALAATTRTLTALNTTTYKGLGYLGPTKQIGSPILTAQSGSTSSFTPIGFALTGGKDPINTAVIVPAYTTIPIGAAPIVFIYNNGGSFSSSVADLTTGIKGDGTANTAGSYKLANLFDGTTSCDTHNPAFTGGSGDGGGTALTIFLREPLSGTMNTTEYTTFRTTGNVNDSQETGVINPTRSPYNPLNLGCPNKGARQRRIGNGQVVSAVNSTVNGMGYMFWSFANASAVIGSNAQANYQYLTLDGVDPIGLSTTNQQLFLCTTPTCPSSLWSGSVSYPNLRNGTYKAWSMYRWLVYTPDTDPLGPTALSVSIQDNIDTTVADFVPFVTSTNSDGMEVYREHFTQSGKTCSYTSTILASQTCDGTASPTESLTRGNSIGGLNEQGGDEGGVIIGWDHSTVTTTKVTTGSCVGNTKVAKTAGRTFGFSGSSAGHTTGQPLKLVGLNVTINGSSQTVSSCINPTSTTLYVTGQTGTIGTGLSFSAYITPTTTGTLGGDNGALTKKQ